MGDHAYTRISIPLSAFADRTMSETIRTAIGLSIQAFQAAILADPLPDEASGHTGCTVRMLEGRPCLVFEKEDCNWGGSEIEQALANAGVPYLQANATGHEYGPSATAFVPGDSETIRLSHDLAPVIGIGVIDGRITLDQQEVRDFERYQHIRRAVLLWPAQATRAA